MMTDADSIGQTPSSLVDINFLVLVLVSVFFSILVSVSLN